MFQLNGAKPTASAIAKIATAQAARRWIHAGQSHLGSIAIEISYDL